MRATYKHTNIIARDWRKLAAFYETVFGCRRVPPERNLSGSWLASGTGVENAELSGVQLRLPGCGASGPTLELFQYSDNLEKPPPVANREGWGHIAFAVDDVAAAMAVVLENGGKKVGDVASFTTEGVGMVTFVYIADPEGNLIELQSIKS